MAAQRPKSPTMVQIEDSLASGKVPGALRLLATGVLEVRDKVQVLSEETYGNGIPGGLKLQVHDLKSGQETIMSELQEINQKLQHLFDESQKSYGRRKTDLLSSTNDPFRKFVAWVTDKILPPLLIALIVWIGQIIFFGAVVLFLFTTGILHF